jgi:hypothetical protein
MSEIEKVENNLFLCNNTIDHDNTKSLRMLKSPLVFRRGYTRGF